MKKRNRTFGKRENGGKKVCWPESKWSGGGGRKGKRIEIKGGIDWRTEEQRNPIRSTFEREVKETD